MKILVIEDDQALSDLISNLLVENSYQVEQIYNGTQGLESALTSDYDLILLDILLPGIQGIEILKRLREQSNIPVMIISACGAEQERITGYSYGADDYLPKPFNPTELILRIEAILRRVKPHSLPETNIAVIETASFSLDKLQNLVFSGTKKTELTPISFRLLLELVQKEGVVLSKPYLYKTVLNKEFSRYDRSLDMHLSRVRRKLSEAGLDHSRIETVHGEGYCFK